jgi:hypothetical protein
MHHNVSTPALVPAHPLTPALTACSARLQSPPGASQPISRAHFTPQASLAPVDAPSSPKPDPQVCSTDSCAGSSGSKCLWLTADNPTATQAGAYLCSYIEIQDDDDDDDDELPPIPDDWANPIIATHCHTPLQPQTAAAVCASPAPDSFHPSSDRSTEDNTRDYKWLTDIFAVRIHFHHSSILFS